MAFCRWGRKTVRAIGRILKEDHKRMLIPYNYLVFCVSRHEDGKEKYAGAKRKPGSAKGMIARAEDFKNQ